MSTFEVRMAAESDDGIILNLIRQSPQPGRVVLNFEREPSFYYGARVTCDKPDVLVVFHKKTGDLAAVGNIGSRPIYVNGEEKDIRYAHDLRVATPYRGSLALVRMFREGKKKLMPNEWLQTVILAENEASISTVGSGRAGLPTYYPHGDIVTSLIFSPPRFPLKHAYTIRKASADDLPKMQSLLDEEGPKHQFFPSYKLKKIIEGSSYFRDIRISDYWLAFDGDTLVGMVGVWNQKGFKQTRLIQYPGGLAWARHLYNLWSRLFGGVHLPAAGGVINYRTLHSVITRGDKPEVLAALIEPIAHIARRERMALVCAFFAQDPMRAALKKFTVQKLMSKHYLVSYDDDPGKTLDDRMPYIEVARL